MVGCDKSSPSVSKEPVVIVGSHVLTDEMVKSRVVLVEALKLRKKPNMKPEERGKFRAMMAKTYPKFFVADAVQADYATKEGLVISEDRIATNRQVVFRAYRKRGEKTYDDMLKALGDSAGELEQQVRSEALSATVKEHFLKLYPTNIPPSYADEQVAEMERQNREMQVTNAFLFATATNVWRRLQKGEDFVKLAEEYTQIVTEQSDAGYWGEFDVDQLDHEPKVVRFGRTAKPGDYTAPIEADNGLMILRLDSREKNEMGATQFRFSRIFFMLPEFYLPAPKDAILRAAMKRYENDLYERKLGELIKAANPVYRADGEKKKSDLKNERKKGK